jgi:hypothetical protein
VPLADASQTFADMTERRTWSNKVLFAVSAQALAEVDDPDIVPANRPALQEAGSR